MLDQSNKVDVIVIDEDLANIGVSINQEYIILKKDNRYIMTHYNCGLVFRTYNKNYLDPVTALNVIKTWVGGVSPIVLRTVSKLLGGVRKKDLFKIKGDTENLTKDIKRKMKSRKQV